MSDEIKVENVSVEISNEIISQLKDLYGIEADIPKLVNDILNDNNERRSNLDALKDLLKQTALKIVDLNTDLDLIKEVIADLKIDEDELAEKTRQAIASDSMIIHTEGSSPQSSPVQLPPQVMNVHNSQGKALVTNMLEQVDEKQLPDEVRNALVQIRKKQQEQHKHVRHGHRSNHAAPGKLL